MSRRMRIKGVLNLKPKVGAKSDVSDVNKAPPPEPSTLVKDPESVPGEVSLKSEENLDDRTLCDSKDSVVPSLSEVQEVEVSSKDDATKSVTTIEVIESSSTFVKPSVSVFSQRTIPKPTEAPSETAAPNVTYDIPTTLDSNPAKHLNRSRIKAVPILTRQAGSASESEDDPKRVRTESVSQSQPNHYVTQEHSTIVQRKCRRSEQSRKMAEAKKTFATKFGDKNPDKQKLTMIDLIFYNPTSNPMPQKQKKPNTITEKEYQQKSEEVNEDDPPPPVESDEENRVPAPRVTVGPNGEIIVDEKSLVIEDRDVKRKRAELEKSEAIDADFEGGSGFYKRVKRCKDWTKEETLLFYRCLNTLGTDFTMMTQLFKGRTRKELKMKFKKEERLNSYLINKAISHPVHFNINDLKEEVENQEKTVQQNEEKKKRLKEAQAKVTERIPYRTNRGKNTYAKNRICKMKHKPVKSKMTDTYSSLERGFKLSSSDSEDSDEEETSKLLRPTRSGRVPKLNKTFDNSEELVDDEKEQAEGESLPENLVPGSIVIVTTPTEDGGTRMQVFMSTLNGSQVPLTISPEMLNSLMSQHALLNSQDVSSSSVEVKLPAKDDSSLEETACGADSCDLVIDE